MRSFVDRINLAARGGENATNPYRARSARLKRQGLWVAYVVGLIVSDMIMTSLAFRMAYAARFEYRLPFFTNSAMSAKEYYFSLSVILVPVWILIFAIVGLYRRQNLLGGTDEYSLVANGTTVGMLFLVFFGFLTPIFVIARGWLFMAWVLSMVFVGIGRFVLRRGVYLMRNRGRFMTPTLIVGANEEGLMLARQFQETKTAGLEILGFVDKKFKPGVLLPGNLRVLGHIDQLDQVIREYGVEEIILASSAISTRDKLMDIYYDYGINNHVNVHMSSGVYEIITTGLTVKEYASVPLVNVNKMRLTGMNRLLKALLDYSIAIPVTLLISPLLVIIAILVKLDSPGPIIHRRRVLGMNGRQFDALKFRTMHVNGDAILEQYPELKEKLARDGKLKNDPRITRIGKFLRRSSLDEIPQFINVLRHEMSVVGPRIISPGELEKYEQFYINLLTVNPGITGLWQVSGRSDISYEERVRLDMHYIRNWSIWLDLQLCFRTLPAILKHKGAY